MKERPILFKTEMVQAILNGTKTMTRRVIKMRDGSLMQDEDYSTHLDDSFDCIMDFTKTYPCWQKLNCPYGAVGDLLWCKETFTELQEPDCFGKYLYKSMGDKADKWKPSIFMPKAAARIWLEITDIKVERLQDISEGDAKAEGVSPAPCCYAYYHGFSLLWESINGAESWNQNPWVWALTFKRIQK